MEKVIPAVPQTSEKSLKELSPQEFQQILKSWFDEKGLVQDMKTYLKFQMINMLQNTPMGKQLSRKTVHTCSLPQQALQLIVAEYLLHSGCNFAFSLFTSEVNLSNVFPNTKVFLETNSLPKEQCRFDKENFVSILELLGIPKPCENFKKIFHEYFENHDHSLLSCLLKIMSNNAMNIEERDQQNEEFTDDFLKNVQQLLQSYNLPQKTHINILNSLKICYDLKNRSNEDQILKLISEFKKELKIRESKLESSYRRKKHLEKKIDRLKKENQKLREKLRVVKEAPVEVQRVIEKNIPVECILNHCDQKCITLKKICDSLKKESEELKHVNNTKTQEVTKLSRDYRNLLNEFGTYLNRINMMNMNLNLNEDVVENYNQEMTVQEKSLSDSSDDWTEEVLTQARHKLKLLEEESKELDVRIDNFSIK
ncbi:cilia- and flagella-associated protein 57 C-like [Euwallacea fornicatus]|uniref:cilia- and flagella-associated protein 57 C-like n=1 Tax=Euwallacea fornicatus TaxID=995702 RepID=UPI0033901501